MSLYLLTLIAPLVLLLGAGFAFSRRGPRPSFVLGALEAASLVALCGAIGAAVWLGLAGAASTALVGPAGFALTVRLDVVGAAMLVLVTFIGWIVLRYAVTYLDGEARQGAFMGWLAATLATVLVFVQAGDLITLTAAWIATSLCLHRLLLFYATRPQAQRAVAY